MRRVRSTVPAGVTKVRLVGNLEWHTSPTNQLVEIRKNGSTVLGGGAVILRGDSGYPSMTVEEFKKAMVFSPRALDRIGAQLAALGIPES